MDLKHAAAKGARWISAATVVTLALQMGQTAVLARVLAAEDYGLVGMAFLFLRLAEIPLDLGFASAVIQRQERNPSRLSSLFWLTIVFGALLFGLSVACAPLGVLFFQEPRLWGVIVLASAVLLLRPAGQIHMALLEQQLQFRRLAVVEIVSVALGVATAITTAIAGLGVYALILGSLTRVGSWSLLLLVLGRSTWFPSVSFRRADLKGYFGFGLPLVGQRYLNFLEQNIDKLIIGRLLGVDVLGFYVMAWNLMKRPVGAINPILTRVAYPVFCRIQADGPRLARTYAKVVTAAVAINAPIYFGMIVLARPLMRVYLGPGWELSADLLEILALVGVIHAMVNPIGSLLQARGRTIVGFWMDLLLLPITLVTLHVAAPGGAVAVAWAWLLVQTFALLPADIYVRWLVVRMHPLDLPRRLGPLLACAAGMAIAVRLGFQEFTVDHVAAKIAILVPLGALTYVGLLALFRRSLLTEMCSMLGMRADEDVPGE